MMNKLNKIFFIGILLFLFMPLNFCKGESPVSDNVFNKMYDQTRKFQENSGYEATTSNGVAEIISMVIKAFLGLLGIIFIILIILAGYNWMTAAGDEQKVEKAKDTLKRAIIGLIIVVSAYAITYFVFNNLPGGGSGSGGGGVIIH